ncbi:hypothetical protein [Amycolatopsis sp. DSM 110486]|uniref:hypothetical protein n=1 Tax=Amycolatopsis sp. DSM 110486 TaxID=2865832 RepID=UPI001C69C5F8|nr:hypothetical protein [Amycolatopsis sp. DSM 110486]QYN23136.1 hypothetical protein K1T34_12160 [Amycolatopsis sp. DSM 110486]
MADRLFLPAQFSPLAATMPPASAAPATRWEWLDRTHNDLRRLFSGPHGLVAMRLAKVIGQARGAALDEIKTSTSASAA